MANRAGGGSSRATLTAVAPGTCEVRASAGGKTGVCEVTVVAENLIAGFAGGREAFTALADAWEILTDGWARLTVDNAGGTSDVFANFFTVKLAEVPAKATLLLEVRNLTGEASISAATTDTGGNTGAQLGGSLKATADGEYRNAVTPTGFEDATCGLRNFAQVKAGKKCSLEARISLFAGDYTGGYVPHTD